MQSLASALAGKSPRDSVEAGAKLRPDLPQDLLKAKQANADRNFTFWGPQTPQAAIPAGVFPSPETSPLPSPTRKEIPLSAVSCISNPIFGDVADPQKLAASWVTHQHYGDTADQV